MKLQFSVSELVGDFNHLSFFTHCIVMYCFMKVMQCPEEKNSNTEMTLADLEIFRYGK